MMAFCRGCGGELPDDPLYAVTQDEAREFSELKVGDYWCMAHRRYRNRREPGGSYDRAGSRRARRRALDSTTAWVALFLAVSFIIAVLALDGYINGRWWGY